MRPNYRQSNKHFTFHNENPKGKLTASDCVIRAIGYGTGMGWDKTFEELSKVAFEIKDSLSATPTYKEWFKRNGYQMMKQPKKADNTRYTLKQFAKKNPEGIFIVNLAGHLTCVHNGIIIDTWDCGESCVGNYWRVK